MIHSDSLQYRLDEDPMAPKKKTSTRGLPTPADIKRLARAHIKAEDALRHAELKVIAAKKSGRKNR